MTASREKHISPYRPVYYSRPALLKHLLTQSVSVLTRCEHSRKRIADDINGTETQAATERWRWRKRLRCEARLRVAKLMDRFLTMDLASTGADSWWQGNHTCYLKTYDYVNRDVSAFDQIWLVITEAGRYKVLLCYAILRFHNFALVPSAQSSYNYCISTV